MMSLGTKLVLKRKYNMYKHMNETPLLYAKHVFGITFRKNHLTSLKLCGTIVLFLSTGNNI